MPVLFVVNRASGRGRAVRLARLFARAFEAAGEPFEICDAHSGTAKGEPREEYFRRFDAVAAVGGDGTLHHLLPDARRAGVPLYHVPAGNENLFAREFGMTGEPRRLLRALQRGESAEIDLPSIGGREFAIMVSFGPDAGVVHRLDGVRSRATGHAMYLGPVLREAFEPRMADVSVRVGGREMVPRGRGLLVVANCGQYAGRLNPARGADMADGLLDAVFLPGGSTAEMLLWAWRCAAGEPLDPHAVCARGATVEVTAHAPVPVQADGEAAGWLDAGQTATITLRHRAMRVLRPERGD